MPRLANVTSVSRAAIAVCTAALLFATCGGTPREPAAGAPADNAELITIIAADQADRELPIDKIDWASVNMRDAARRGRVRALIAAGQLRTGKDFDRASLVFQHGETNDEILFAHVLAMTALAQGHTDSRRLAALTLDRYLNRLGQPQVFGTQFRLPDVSRPTEWSLEPYNESLVPDSIRALNCVASRETTRQFFARLQTGDMSDPAPVCPETPDH